MRYGNANAAFGPGVEAPVSGLLVGVDESGTEVGGGGGSITEVAAAGFETGSGSAGIGSSGDDVSMVMCLVTGGDVRRV